jgi:molecular chaperone DnaJ
MDYYAEFGIPRDASAATYKTLARVLHPDAHPDEALKGMAERQMKRLNAVLETLLDPEKRRAYDASLLEAARRRRRPPRGAGRTPLPAPASAAASDAGESGNGERRWPRGWLAGPDGGRPALLVLNPDRADDVGNGLVVHGGPGNRE